MIYHYHKGLSYKEEVHEQCFDSIPDNTIRTSGLTAGLYYSLRIVLYGTIKLFNIYSVNVFPH